MELPGISGKVVLITGASGSIGSATAVEFARLGAILSLTGRDEQRLKCTARRCFEAGAKPGQVDIVTRDITNEDDIQNIIKTTVDTFGGIDILVNCAGSIRSGGLLTTKLSDYDLIFKTNVKGIFLVCQHAMPYIIKAKGNIVNLSSFTGIRPACDYFAYTVAEAALDAMTRCLAFELGPKGVRINSVNPGVVRGTSLWTRDGAPFANNPDVADKIQNELPSIYPLRRIAEVDDVIKTITFLCSSKASFIHGVALPLDGAKILTSTAGKSVPKT